MPTGVGRPPSSGRHEAHGGDRPERAGRRGLKEQIDLKIVHLLLVGLLVPVGIAGRTRLRPVQGYGQRVAPVAPPNPILSGQVVARQRQRTVVPKLVVEILVTRHDGRWPTSRRTLDALLARPRSSPPAAASGPRPVGFAQQRNAALSRPLEIADCLGLETQVAHACRHGILLRGRCSWLTAYTVW